MNRGHYFKKTGIAITATLLLCFIIWKALFLYNFYFGNGWESTEQKQGGDYVILLHGLRSSAGCMDHIARFLDEKGYTVINFDYPSSKYDIETLAENYLDQLFENCCDDKTKKINIITHSMGGIVLRQYLKDNSIQNIGKTIMISPPNHGSEWSDYFGDKKIAEWIMGPALKQLKTGESGITRNLPSQTTEFAIITGGNPGMLGNFLNNGENDGKVSVNSAKLEGMYDFKLVEETHMTILSSGEVMEAIDNFMKTGKF